MADPTDDNQDPFAEPQGDPAPGAPSVDDQIKMELSSSPTTNPQPAAPQAPQLGSVSQKAGVKYSSKGFGPDKGQGALWQQGEQGFMQDDARLQGQRDQELASTQSAYAAQGQAELNHGEVLGSLYKEQSRLMEQQQNFLRDSAAVEQHMYAQTKAESAQYLDAYKQQLAAVRQMTVVSPQSTLSKWQAGGLSMAMFAQGFLAARGIHIDVAGQVDRWVQQSLHEQETNIQNARANANDQFNLYQIARQTANDDIEAYHRYRGMVIEAMKTGIDAAAMRFQAPLAASAAQVAKAKLDVEQTNSLNAITNNYEVRRNAEKQQALDEVHKKIHDRQQEELLGIEQMKAAAAKNATAANTVKLNYVIRDPSTNKPTHIIYPGDANSDKRVETVAKAQSDYRSLDDALKIAMDFQKQAQLKYGHGGLWDNRDEAKRVYDEMLGKVRIAYGHANFGSNQTEAELARLEKMVPFEKWYQSGGNERVFANYRNGIREDFQGVLDSNAHALNDKADFGDGSGLDTAGPDQVPMIDRREVNVKAKNDAMSADFGLEKQKSPGEKEVGQIDAKDTNRDRGKASAYYILNARPDRPGEALGDRKDRTMPGNYVHVDNALRIAAEPEHFISAFDLNRDSKHFPGALDELKKQYSQEATDALYQLYEKTDDTDLRNYIGKGLEDLKKDPQGLLKMLTDTGEK